MTNTILLSAVYTSQTNWLLKKMVTQINKYDKSSFIKFLGADIANVKPIYFNGMDYKKAEHENNLFIFLDADCRIMGILYGNTWNKERHSKFEFYDYRKDMIRWVKKSRKGLTEAATHILMFTPEMRMYKQKQNVKPKSRFKAASEARSELQHRLQKYKLKKYSEVTYEEVLKISQELIVYVAQNLFNPEMEVSLPRKMREVFSFCDDMHKLVGYLSELSRDYYRIYQEYKTQIARRAEMRDGEWEYFSNWRMKDLNGFKAKIITINQMVKGE